MCLSFHLHWVAIRSWLSAKAFCLGPPERCYGCCDYYDVSCNVCLCVCSIEILLRQVGY